MQKGWVNHPNVESYIGNDLNWIAVGGGGKAFSSDLLSVPPQGSGTLLTATLFESKKIFLIPIK